VGRPDEILKALALKPGEKVADIGSGGGYFTLRFAEAVGRKGRVYAVDTNPGFLEFIENSAREKGLDNIETVLVKEGEPALPEGSLDLVFTRSVYHHLPGRIKYFRNLMPALKPDGRVVVLEYTRGGFFRRIFGHYVDQETIVKEMESAGYKVEKKFEFLPEQSFTVFSLGE
ncbi:MAG: methyltransferase domain-containing protein, partial [Candidatus Aenigmarchaeota archaeon]|nr:methyltransferase domain-containing protein [Candidatus Aenigmarchaeota archaeon]